MSLQRRSAVFLTLLGLVLPLYTSHVLATVQVPHAPAPLRDANLVHSNFLGISFELSYMNYYFGNSSEQTPPAFVAYLSALAARSSGKPIRLRAGGNTMDSSTYDPHQADMIKFIGRNSRDDQPVTFGPKLFNVMKSVSSSVGGAQYLIGLSLRKPHDDNIALLAGDISQALGNDLDAALLGNEPDLYGAHGHRPSGYTIAKYIDDYDLVSGNLQHTPKGNFLSENKMAGPTICCAWSLEAVLKSGWYERFAPHLKYITVQHYPQNDCNGKARYRLDYYTKHAEVVQLAKWSSSGIEYLATRSPRKPLLMDEFNTASCGGIPGQSDTFAAALWTVDYALQMAAVGYSGAYLHTREKGVTYNLWDGPAVPGEHGAWTANPSFYGMLPVAEALDSASGSRVADLDVQGSMKDREQTVAGYVVYDGKTGAAHSIVLFNYANARGAMEDFAVPASLLAGQAKNITVRYLSAESWTEKKDIAWGGKTYAGTTDGQMVEAKFASSVRDKAVLCDGHGCNVSVPGPGLAVVFLGKVPTIIAPTGSASKSGVGEGSTTKDDSSAGSQSTTVFTLLWGALVGVAALF